MEAPATRTMTERHAVTEASRVLPLALTTRRYTDREVFTVSPHEPIQVAAVLMEAGGVRHLPLVEDGRVVGVVSARDTSAVLADRRADAPSGALGGDDPVSELVQRPPELIGPDVPLREAAVRMDADSLGCLPIVDHDGALLGMVSRQDLARELAALCLPLPC